MNAEIITIGTELLMGQILNTNAQFLAQQINGLGVNHYVETVIGDNPKRLKKILKQAEDRSDIIILTGGLGPTRDDLTKEIVSDYLSEDLVLHEPTLEKIKSYFLTKGREFTDNNQKMALTFKNGESFDNKVGQAVGTAIEKDKRLYVILPGPPRELQPMFKDEVRPYLINYLDEKLYITSTYLNYYGIGESSLANKLDDIIQKQTNPSIALYVNGTSVSARLTAFGNNLADNQDKLDELAAQINKIAGEWFYGEGYDYSPAKAVFNYLKDSQQIISFAESLTGGEAANQLVNVEGSSEVFRGSIVAYDAYAKENALGVSHDVIEQFGTVSAECAKEMAENVRDTFQTDIGVSFTGVAGPAAMEGKKPGTVFVGIARQAEETEILELNLWGDRQNVRLRAIHSAFVHLVNNNN